MGHNSLSPTGVRLYVTSFTFQKAAMISYEHLCVLYHKRRPRTQDMVPTPKPQGPTA